MFSRLQNLLRPRNGSRDAYRFHLRYWFDPDVDLTADVLATMRPARAAQPDINNGPAERRITVLAPHPDDEVMGPGGTLIKAKQRGAEIEVIFLSDGETDPEKARIRRAEGDRATKQLGFGAHFLGLPAFGLAATPDAVAALAGALRDTAPEVLFVPFLLDDNDDHRAANRIFAAAAGPADLDPATEVWAYQVYSALPGNVLVPLGNAAAEKTEAIRLYQSQAAVRDWAHYALALNAVNTRFAPRACDDPYLEAFFVLPLADYVQLVESFPAVR